ncbi:MAG: CoA pyrophosphatase [Rhodobacteraceae bacterium]|nr:CoA pyrophosphatase [Paracoccaceae bacterium]
MKPKFYSVDDVARVIAEGRHESSSDFDLNPEAIEMWPPAVNLRPAAVLIGLTEGRDGLNIILTKRASHLKHHPGQIALPGGKVEPGDNDETATALREAEEEIGLERGNVRILGHMPFHQTITSFRVMPVVGHIEKQFQPRPEAGEVEEVFEVPLGYLADPGNYLVEGRYWGGVKRRYYTIPYGPYYIWGATARMLMGLAVRLSK